MSMVDKSEILYDAFKETYFQAKTLYKINIIIGLFALLVIFLVVRDNVIMKSAEPKIVSYETSIQLINTELNELEEKQYKSPAGFFEAKKNLTRQQAELDNWHGNKPGRKNMKAKYEKLLKEYSGSHEKVLERLKIDGEPGLDLFNSLKETFISYEDAVNSYNTLELNRKNGKQQFAREIQTQKNKLENKKRETEIKIKTLKDEITRIQFDETRLPWLGLRVNPQDITPLLPIILMIFFHVLFYKFEELMAITINPALKDFKEELSKYPLPIFLGRRNLYAMLTIIFLFGLVPLVQISAITLTWQHKLGFLSLGQSSWTWMAGVGIVCALLTISYPAMIVKHYHKQIMSS